MRLRIIEHKTYDSENYLTNNYFTVQYHTKLFGIFPMWRTLKNLHMMGWNQEHLQVRMVQKNI